MCVPSGDHDGTLIVPWPPYTYAITFGGALPSTGMIRRSGNACSTGDQTAATSSPYEMMTIHLPSGEKCGNQSLNL